MLLPQLPLIQTSYHLKKTVLKAQNKEQDIYILPILSSGLGRLFYSQLD